MTERRSYKGIVSDNARWDSVMLRPDDVIISTPPKCGTTWMQTSVGLVLFQEPDLPAPLSELSPWVDMLTWPLDELVSTIEGQSHRRFLKTHTPLDGLPWDERVTYICVGRDPRDVALSWDNHLASMDIGNLMTARIAAVGADDLDPSMIPEALADPVDRFWAWIEDDGVDDISGLASLVNHLDTFWSRRGEPNVHLFHYGEMQQDLSGQLHRLAAILGVSVPDDRWDTLVQAATFEQMKAKADVLAPDTTHKIWQDNARFFHHGRTGRWREVMGDDDVPRYRARLDALASPDLVEWLHRGSLAPA
jgi:aryl sulfotransferase